MVAVVVLPSLQFFPDIAQRDELVDIEELIEQAHVERIEQVIIRGLSRAGVVEFDPPALRQFVEHFRGELRLVFHGDCFGPSAAPGDFFQRLSNASA